MKRGELVAGDALIAGLTACMLRARAALWVGVCAAHKVVIAVVRRDELCRRFMRIPGVGPISALAFKTAVDDPLHTGSAARRRWEPISG